MAVFDPYGMIYAASDVLKGRIGHMFQRKGNQSHVRLLSGASFACSALALCGIAVIHSRVSATGGVQYTTTATEPTATVYVTGAVVHPGDLQNYATARVQDAVTMAGGMSPQANPATVNLAATIFDGEEIDVLRIGETPFPSQLLTDLKININIATAATLHTQLGISLKVATAIVTYREQHGLFKSVADLLLVPISQTIYKRIAPKVTVA